MSDNFSHLEIILLVLHQQSQLAKLKILLRVNGFSTEPPKEGLQLQSNIPTTVCNTKIKIAPAIGTGHILIRI